MSRPERRRLSLDDLREALAELTPEELDAVLPRATVLRTVTEREALAIAFPTTVCEGYNRRRGTGEPVAWQTWCPDCRAEVPAGSRHVADDLWEAVRTANTNNGP